MSLTPPPIKSDHLVTCYHYILCFAFMIVMTIIMIICVKKKKPHTYIPLQLVLGVTLAASIQCIKQDLESRRGRHHLLLFLAIAEDSHGHCNGTLVSRD